MGCGEEARRAPAPPPAPPPFQSQAVEVTLGEHGGSITLMTAQSGGYTRNGEPFQSGAKVEAENGNEYRLTLSDGRWSAEFLPPEPLAVTLGTSGGAVRVTRTEGGEFQTDGKPLGSGDIVEASNGNRYRLTLSAGEWSAEFLPPKPSAVALGKSGEAVLVTQTEGGQFRVDGEPFGLDGIVEASNGNRYRLTRRGDDWVSEFIPTSVQVLLGEHGGSLTLRREEDGNYWLGNRVFESGRVVTGSNGNVYRLTLRDGAWNAEYIPEPVRVSLGTSGASIVLVRLEDGSYWDGEKVVGSGSRVTASDGSVYTLALRDGVWIADLLSGPGLPGPPSRRRSDTRAVYEGVEPELKKDDEGNPGTILEVGGSEYSVYDLFARRGVTRSETFVDRAQAELKKVLTQIKLLIQIEEAGDDDLSSQIRDRWDLAVNALDGLFGAEADDVLGEIPEDDDEIDTAQAVAVLEEVIDSLSSLRAFERALEDGVFRNSTTVDEDNVEEVFDAVRSVTRMRFGWTPNTRFGAYMKQQREDDALDDLRLLDGDEGHGVFAYSPLETSSTADLPSGGEASYRGQTLAVSGGDDPDLYSGMIELRARFSTRRVSALITNLRNEDGDGWSYPFTEVETISLPNAFLSGSRRSASFQVSGEASILYPLSPGGPTSRILESDFEGRFVGEANDAGEAVIGTWDLQNSRGNAVLTGSFGAEYKSTTTRTAPDIDDAGTVSRTFFEAEPDDSGDILLSGADEDGIQFQASQLYSDGGGVSIGDRLFTVVRSEIARHLTVLDAIIELEDDTLRQALWTRVNDVLDTKIFDGDAEDLFGEDYPTTRRGDPDDVAAEEILTDAWAALGSVRSFRNALEEDGVFYPAREAASEPADMYATVEHELTVEYRHTNYTRFGAWARLVGTSSVSSMEVDADNPPDVFAYSPLTQTVYEDLDPAYPRDVHATYSGQTVAVEVEAEDPRIFEGSIEFSVEWGPDLRDTVIHSVIRNLRTAEDGVTFQHEGADVDGIFFSDLRMRNGFGEVLEFDERRPNVRIRYQNLRLGERTWTGSSSQSGKFVGKSLDGPLAVIGTWSLSDTSAGIDLKGAYGADLSP